MLSGETHKVMLFGPNTPSYSLQWGSVPRSRGCHLFELELSPVCFVVLSATSPQTDVCTLAHNPLLWNTGTHFGQFSPWGPSVFHPVPATWRNGGCGTLVPGFSPSHLPTRQGSFPPKRAGSGSDCLGSNSSLSSWLCDLDKQFSLCLCSSL